MPAPAAMSSLSLVANRCAAVVDHLQPAVAPVAKPSGFGVDPAAQRPETR
jgi:hypothetical protein